MRANGLRQVAVFTVLLWLTGGHGWATPVPVAGPGQQEERIEPIDVNRATAAQLQSVPGIGPATAQRIIEWRDEHGRFERLEDLLNIRGIGEKTLEKLRPYLTVGQAEQRLAAG